MPYFEILKSISPRNLCDMILAKSIELSNKGYTAIDCQYSSVFNVEVGDIEYSVLIIANKE